VVLSFVARFIASYSVARLLAARHRFAPDGRDPRDQAFQLMAMKLSLHVS
jgi:hypothetical protein